MWNPGFTEWAMAEFPFLNGSTVSMMSERSSESMRVSHAYALAILAMLRALVGACTSCGWISDPDTESILGRKDEQS